MGKFYKTPVLARKFENSKVNIFFFIYLFIIKRAKLPLKIDYVFWCVFVALSRNSESWRTPISFYDHTQSQFCFQIVTEQFASCTGMHHSLMEHEIFAIKFSRRNSLSFPKKSPKLNSEWNNLHYTYRR